MLTNFSSSYWLSSFLIYPGDEDTASIHTHHHDRIKEFYSSQTPVIAKIKESHLQIEPSDSTPTGVVTVDREILEKTRIENPPSKEPVLIAKPETAKEVQHVARF